MEQRRKRRVAELIRDNTSQIIQRELAGLMPAMVTVMRVDLSDDLKYAKLFVSFYGKDEDKKRSVQFLRKNLKTVRKHLSSLIKMRSVPFLSIVEDESLDHAFKIENILIQIKNDEESDAPESD